MTIEKAVELLDSNPSKLGDREVQFLYTDAVLYGCDQLVEDAGLELESRGYVLRSRGWIKVA